jgi:hypothetical protein
MARHVYLSSPARWLARGPIAVVEITLALTVVVFALAFVSAARAGDRGRPAITLGPISVANGVAAVTGSVGDDPTAEVNLTIDGRPVGIDASGHFSAVVDLDGSSFLVLTLVRGSHEVVTIRIPLAVAESGGSGVLAALQRAGITLDVPPDGFELVDGQLGPVTGTVRDPSRLASLTVNGKDVLAGIGNHGAFGIDIGGAPKQVAVAASDRRGVSETNTFRTTKLTTVIRTRSGTSVSAAGAKGVVIARVRFVKRGLLTHRRLGVLVTVKDRRGFLVRGAAVHLTGLPSRYLANGGRRAGFTNRIGMRRFAFVLTKRAFTDRMPRRLTLKVRASTARASALRAVRTRLPAVSPT